MAEAEDARRKGAAEQMQSGHAQTERREKQKGDRQGRQMKPPVPDTINDRLPGQLGPVKEE
jgi:hypothetical protein